jgi:non-ribosomal peptide synthetase component F/molybdopterin/thiamine biosynthesis adenylyltransferase/acyl carrier protein
MYLLAERLLDYIRQKEITYLKVTPSFFSTLVNSPGFSEANCRTLRLAAVGGEAINVMDIEKAHSLCRRLQIMNHYGPTEATIGSVATLIDFHHFADYKKHPVIGKPIANTGVYILNQGLDLLPIGVPGELYISGTCVARGYLNRPELTAERFNRSYKSYRTYIFYKTGDLARCLPDGNVEFLGRADHQVKVRGYRIELGEIESQLMKHPLVEEALVTVKEKAKELSTSEGSTGNQGGDKYICAYIVSKNGKPGIPAAGKTAGIGKILKLKEIEKEENFVRPPGATSVPLTIVSRFEEQVKKNPDKIAVKSASRSLTYLSLDRYADRAARIILENYNDRYKLSKEERTRYKRQMLLYGWGQESQEKLKSTSAFVAGAGGGASPTVTQLALAGFGTIKICDFDEVELSNLNRQFIHDHERLGMNKALSARMTVSKTNPHVKVIPCIQKLTRDNVFEIVGDADIIFDMFDGPADKFVLSECAVVKGIPHVIISMTDINAYTTVCHAPHTPCYHCIFDREKLETIVSGMQNYVENYSKNPLPVVATSLFISTGTAVNEALKILLGFKKPAYNKFFYFNQRGEEENLVFTPGYKAMTHLFSDHFLQVCKEQGFDWDTGWRGNFLEELAIKPDPHCPLCSEKGRELRKTLEQKKKTGKTADFPLEVRGNGEVGTSEKIETVSLLLNRDIDMAAGIVGVLKSGKTYAPLDPALPVDSLAYMLEDSESRIILTNNDHFSLAEKLRDRVNKNIKVIDMNSSDELKENGSEANPKREHLNIDIALEQAAYILYSPGSTERAEAGEKTVVESHRDVLDFVRTYTYHLQHYPGDTPVLSSSSSYSLNAGMTDFYLALLDGTGVYTFENNRPETGQDSLSSELRGYLLKDLPDYMIPSYFVQLDKMPLTPNGKVNREALPEPETVVEKRRTAPRNALEEKLAGIWSDVLAVEKYTIGVDSNFFQLGGHSLNATIMVARVHKELNVKLPLGEVFKTPTLAGLAKFVANEGTDIYASIQPVEKKEYYPLSSAQMRMFLIGQIKTDTTSDNTTRAIMLEGHLDRERFEKAVHQLIKRHEVLRTSFEMIHHQPVQRVHETVNFKIADLGKNTGMEAYTDHQVKDIVAGFIRPFDLGMAPLLRVGLLKLPEQRHLLVYDVHHIINDAVSLQLFSNEFISLYAGVKLPGLRIQYKDFATWQNKQLTSGAFKKQEEYWLSVYSGDIPTLNMPTDFPRPQVQDFDGEFIEFTLEKDLTGKIDEIASETGATLHMALLCIYNILLYKYTGDEDIVVGSSSAGRPHADLQDVIGFFINTLAIRNYPEGEKTFLDFLKEVRDNALKAYDNQDYQFDELVNRLGIVRKPGRQVLFDTHFTLHNVQIDMKNPDVMPGDLTFTPYPLADRTTQFDIIFHGFEVNGGVYFTLGYCTKLFKEETIRRFAGYYQEIAHIVAENKDIKLKDIKISHTLEAAQANMPKADFNF